MVEDYTARLAALAVPLAALAALALAMTFAHGVLLFGFGLITQPALGVRHIVAASDKNVAQTKPKEFAYVTFLAIAPKKSANMYITYATISHAAWV